MTALKRPATTDGLFLWVMHQFASSFDQHAILKGGMALRLLDSPRSTTDIDYVFVPYTSKRDVKSLVESALSELGAGTYEIDLHSKMLRARLRVDDAEIQIEINVASECPVVAMSTGGFARGLGQPSQVVAMMDTSRALADKLAAWNERRLLRDLYDCYFLTARIGARVDWERLDQRLSNVESRRPELKRRTSMTREDLATALQDALEGLDQQQFVESELGPLLSGEELAGLGLRMRSSISRLIEKLQSEDGD